MAKAEKNLSVVSLSLSDGSGNEIPAVALVAAPGEALRLDEPWQRELARERALAARARPRPRVALPPALRCSRGR